MRDPCSARGSLLPLLATGVLLTGCADVVVGYFSGTAGTSASESSTGTTSLATTDATDATDTTSAAPTGGADGSTGEGFTPPGCFTDDFADGVVDDPRWTTWAEADAYLGELDGRLELVPPTYGVFDTGVVGRFDHRFAFETGWVRLRVLATPPADRPAGLFLVVEGESERLMMRVAGGSVAVIGALGEDQLVFEQSFPTTPYPSFIGIRAEGAVAHFEVSEDGETWTTLATYDKPGPFADAAALIMAQTFSDYPDRATVAIDDLEVCVQ